MSLYGVQRASSKTDCQVIDKEFFEDVLGNTRGQLVNLQSKACHSQDTASWNTFLWVEFIRECCSNSDSDSPVPEIFWNKNRQSASEANPVKVSDDAILPGCLIGFLQVKEETNCQLPLRKGISEIPFNWWQNVEVIVILLNILGIIKLTKNTTATVRRYVNGLVSPGTMGHLIEKKHTKRQVTICARSIFWGVQNCISGECAGMRNHGRL